MASTVRQHEAELASKAADMAAMSQQHASAQRQAAESARAELAAALARHAQQLQEAQAAAGREAADADERFQDAKDLLMALQARFNNRSSSAFYPAVNAIPHGHWSKAGTIQLHLLWTQAVGQMMSGQTFHAV